MEDFKNDSMNPYTNGFQKWIKLSIDDLPLIRPPKRHLLANVTGGLQELYTGIKENEDKRKSIEEEKAALLSEKQKALDDKENLQNGSRISANKDLGNLTDEQKSETDPGKPKKRDDEGGGLKEDSAMEVDDGSDDETSPYTDEEGEFVPQVGMQLMASRYKYVEVLAKGQSALIVKALDTFSKDKPVAIKVLHRIYKPIGSQEADILLELHRADPWLHVPFARLQNQFIYGPHYCLVFEFLSPTPLYTHYEQKSIKGPKSIPHVRNLCVKLLTVLGFFHKQNIIHADLKPENILLKDEEDMSSVMVIDFGNALRNTEEELSLYYTDFELQTLLYRSPEVIFGLKFSLEIDMWSLGCLLAECYIGQPLFMAKSKQDILTKITKLLGPFPKEFAEGEMAYNYINFIGRPHTRYQRIESLRKRLNNCQNINFLLLLEGLLTYLPSQRITPFEAACHPFIASVNPFLYLMPTSGQKRYPTVVLDMSTYPFLPGAPKEDDENSTAAIGRKRLSEYSKPRRLATTLNNADKVQSSKIKHEQNNLQSPLQPKLSQSKTETSKSNQHSYQHSIIQPKQPQLPSQSHSQQQIPSQNPQAKTQSISKPQVSKVPPQQQSKTQSQQSKQPPTQPHPKLSSQPSKPQAKTSTQIQPKSSQPQPHSKPSGLPQTKTSNNQSQPKPSNQLHPKPSNQVQSKPLIQPQPKPPTLLMQSPPPKSPDIPIKPPQLPQSQPQPASQSQPQPLVAKEVIPPPTTPSPQPQLEKSQSVSDSPPHSPSEIDREQSLSPCLDLEPRSSSPIPMQTQDQVSSHSETSPPPQLANIPTSPPTSTSSISPTPTSTPQSQLPQSSPLSIPAAASAQSQPSQPTGTKHTAGSKGATARDKNSNVPPGGDVSRTDVKETLKSMGLRCEDFTISVYSKEQAHAILRKQGVEVTNHAPTKPAFPGKIPRGQKSSSNVNSSVSVLRSDPVRPTLPPPPPPPPPASTPTTPTPATATTTSLSTSSSSSTPSTSQNAKETSKEATSTVVAKPTPVPQPPPPADDDDDDDCIILDPPEGAPRPPPPQPRRFPHRFQLMGTTVQVSRGAKRQMRGMPHAPLPKRPHARPPQYYYNEGFGMEDSSESSVQDTLKRLKNYNISITCRRNSAPRQRMSYLDSDSDLDHDHMDSEEEEDMARYLECEIDEKDQGNEEMDEDHEQVNLDSSADLSLEEEEKSLNSSVIEETQKPEEMTSRNKPPNAEPSDNRSDPPSDSNQRARSPETPMDTDEMLVQTAERDSANKKPPDIYDKQQAAATSLSEAAPSVNINQDLEGNTVKLKSPDEDAPPTNYEEELPEKEEQPPYEDDPSSMEPNFEAPATGQEQGEEEEEEDVPVEGENESNNLAAMDDDDMNEEEKLLGNVNFEGDDEELNDEDIDFANQL